MALSLVLMSTISGGVTRTPRSLRRMDYSMPKLLLIFILLFLVLDSASSSERGAGESEDGDKLIPGWFTLVPLKLESVLIDSYSADEWRTK